MSDMQFSTLDEAWRELSTSLPANLGTSRLILLRTIFYGGAAAMHGLTQRASASSTDAADYIRRHDALADELCRSLIAIASAE